MMAPGSRVTVRFAGLPAWSPCSRHLVKDLPIRGAVGIVDRIDAHRGDHSVVVRFPTITQPPFGQAWVDTFTPDELVSADA